MRKILAGFLATSMIVAVASSVTFAANTVAKVSVNAAATSTLAHDAAIDGIELTIDPNGTANDEDDIIVTSSVSKTLVGTGSSNAIQDVDVAKVLDNVKFNDVNIGGKYYTINLKQSGTTKGVNITFSPAGALPSVIVDGTTKIGVKLLSGTTSEAAVASIAMTSGASGNYVPGSGKETADIDTSGKFDTDNVTASQVVKAYGDGTPIPLTEKGVGYDKDQNDEGGVQSSKTLYFMIRDDVIPRLSDDTYWKLKITKGDNGKYVKAITDVTKVFKNDLVDVNTGAPVSGTGDGVRHRYIKVELNEIFTDDEYKITLDLRLSAKSKAVDTLGYSDDTEIKVKDFSFYMKNIVKDADNDWKVGIGGLMLNPLSNDWNDVTYYDEDGDLAHVKFFADSDTSKFYAKLSTKWEHADYASYFNDQDAYIFDFTGSPKLSSTSRADLEIYNPFVDEDGNETIDPESATIYQVIDGDLFDVTDNFTYEEGDNGDMAFVTRTRFLGTYIICEKPVEEAADTDAPDTDLVPEDTTPVEVTPGNDDGGKAPANTGKYL